MGRHVFLAILLLLSMIVFDCSDASFIKNIRKLVDLDPKDKQNPTSKDSPPPAPSQSKSDPNPVDERKVNKDIIPPSTSDNTTTPVPQPQPSGKVESEIGNKKETSNAPPPATAPPPVPKKADDGGGKGQEQEKGKNGGIKLSQSATNDTCDGLNVCTDEGNMIACIYRTDPKYLVVLLQNRGDDPIKVQLRSDFENNLGNVAVDKNKTEKVNITRSSSQSTQLTLNARKGDCVLHMATHVPEGSFVLRFPSYDNILTPVNGAYFLILAVLIFGGTWACCMFRKKRHDEVPYQELEMAQPESVSATNVESADGWDQGWDDDWDDNVAVKSPAAARGISANGLTSRSANKDGWENNWDE